MQATMPTSAAEAPFSKVDDFAALDRRTEALSTGAQSQQAVHEAALDPITATLGCLRAPIALFGENGAMGFVLLGWHERGGPEVVAPTRQGFAGDLLRKTLARGLSGRVNIRYLPAGAVCTIGAPLPAERKERA